MRIHSNCDSRWAGRRGFSFGPGGFHFDFGDGPGSGGWGGGHRGRDRKRMFEGGELRLVLLKLIADEPRHGLSGILPRRRGKADRQRQVGRRVAHLA